MIELEQPLLPMATGRHPVIIIDTSASVAEHLFYVKAFTIVIHNAIIVMIVYIHIYI